MRASSMAASVIPKRYKLDKTGTRGRQAVNPKKFLAFDLERFMVI